MLLFLSAYFAAQPLQPPTFPTFVASPAADPSPRLVAVVQSADLRAFEGARYEGTLTSPNP